MGTKYCVLPGMEDVRVTKLDGRIIIIGEDPREIPNDMVGDAIRQGAISEDSLATLKDRLRAEAPVASPAAKEAVTKTEAPLDSLERAAQINQAVADILEEGSPDDFISNGAPKTTAVEDKLGWDITADERNTAFKTASSTE